MPVRPLPENPSLENLRKQAKGLLDAARRGEPEALALVREFHPRSPAPLALHDAQLALARSFGFPSWPRLVHHLERVEPFAWDPSAGPAATARVDQLIQWACLDYGRWHPDDLDRARARLAGEPTTSLRTAPRASRNPLISGSRPRASPGGRTRRARCSRRSRRCATRWTCTAASTWCGARSRPITPTAYV